MQRLTQSILHSDSEHGAVLLEMLVASTISLFVIAGAYTTLIQHQRTMVEDMHRTRLAQNLRGAMDFISSDCRQAGEQLPAVFPVLLLEDGVSGAADRLTLRRNILSEELTICEALSSGDTVSDIPLNTSTAGAPPSCIYGSQSVALSSWENFLTEEGGSFKAYLFDIGSRQGEYITVTATMDTGTEMTISIQSQTLQNDYQPYTSVLYVIEEWEYSVDADSRLAIVSNDDISTESYLAFNITDFQVSILMEDGSTKTEFLSSDDWSDIQSVEVILSGEDSSGKRVHVDTLTSTFFPRNILSL